MLARGGPRHRRDTADTTHPRAPYKRVRSVALVVDMHHVVDQRRQHLNGLRYLVVRLVQQLEGNRTAGLLAAPDRARVHGRALAAHGQDGDLVVRLIAPQPLEDRLVPPPVAQRAVDDHVLAVGERLVLEDLGDVP